MVVQRTIHHLRQRPHHERHAVALLIAAGVVVALFFAWAYAFFAGIRANEMNQQQAAQTAAADAGVQVVTPSVDSNSGQDSGQESNGQ
jgi:hypothetical protein